MWGNILTELSYIDNFNRGYSNTRSDILIHLTQWQYWWWFWFTFLWVLYYLLVARVFRYRTLKFSPRIATTLRPHGKWGDLLTCLIPITWCMNILLNSSFLLKLIEWQSESSLFTLRVRAKQWYWIYKLDLKNISDIFSVPRNVGRNKWQFSTFADLQTSEDYLHILQLRSQNQWVKKYWKDLMEKSTRSRDFRLISPQEIYKAEFLKNANLTFYKSFLDSAGLALDKNNLYSDDWSLDPFEGFNTHTDYSYIKDPNCISSGIDSLDVSGIVTKHKFFFYRAARDEDTVTKYFNMVKKEDFFKNVEDLQKIERTVYGQLFNNISNNFDTFTRSGRFLNFSEFGDDTRILKRSFGKATPLRVIKNPVVDIFNSKTLKTFADDSDLLRFRFNDFESKLQQKPIPHTTYLTLKQKRYNVRTKIKPTTRVDENATVYSFVKEVPALKLSHVSNNTNNIQDKSPAEIDWSIQKNPSHLQQELIQKVNEVILPFTLSQPRQKMFPFFQQKISDYEAKQMLSLFQQEMSDHETKQIFSFFQQEMSNDELYAEINALTQTMSNDEVEKLHAELKEIIYSSIQSSLNHKATSALQIKTSNSEAEKLLAEVDGLVQKTLPLSQQEISEQKIIKQEVHSMKQETGSVYSKNPFLKNLSIIEDNVSDPTRQYRMLKKAKNRLDKTSINTWNRLLRSKRVLVLPAHINITAITNSYDIVHSWHIPGLGLKMDCLPGRATHHTFYIDNVGLYFGQCAEVCGRYHHHMPIRVCALPYEHFLVWWHTFGLPRLLFTDDKKQVGGKYLFRKFSW